MEQGIDGLMTFELFEDAAGTIPWVFVGFDVNGTISDMKNRVRWDLTIEADPATGTVRAIAPWDTIGNHLRAGREYRYDVLMVAPGAIEADDHFLAAGPVTVPLRSSRRDAP
jgi:hypothetical protein